MMYSSTIHSDEEILRSVGANESGAIVLLLDAETLSPLSSAPPATDRPPVSQPIDVTDLFVAREHDVVHDAVERGIRIAARVDGLHLASGGSASLQVFRLTERPEVAAAVITPDRTEPPETTISEALDLSVEQFRLLGEALPMGVFIWGPNGVLNFANEIGRELMGIKSLRVVARDVRTVEGELLSVIGLIEDITEQHAAREALELAATRDALTGMPNRTLDGFKDVNDTMGHTVGDRLLTIVAERFTDATRPDDMVARFGGDEFVVVTRTHSPASPELAAERIHAALAEPVLLGNRLVDVTASIGIANRLDGTADTDQLLGDADLAMYAAKHAGRNRTVVYNSTLRHAAAQRFDIVGDLRHAVDRGQTRLVYQPIVDLTTDIAVGAESLIRWQHPSYGRLLPNAFIRLAEENGLINALGDWALEQACRDLAQLRASGCVEDEFYMSVNVSMMQLSTVNDLITTAERAIAKYGLRPHNLLFELTESLPLDAIPRASERIRELNNRGFRLAVDDFGTGYSSLEYLTLLPYDVLKIDPSFTSRLDAPDAHGAAEAVLESLVHLSQRLGFDLICEGIETNRQLTQVIGASVQFGQGYLFAQPCALHELDVLLRTGPAAIDLTTPAPLGVNPG